MDVSEQKERAQEVVRALAAQLNPERDLSTLAPSAHLEWDLGIGSLERLELTQRLERELGQRLPAQGVFGARTLRDLLDVVENPDKVDESGHSRTPAADPSIPLPPFPIDTASTLEALVYQADKQEDRVLYHFEQDGHPERSLSPSELLDEAAGMAGSLAALGVKAGDRVGIMLPTGLPFVASFFAVQWLGAVPVPLYPPFRPDQAEDYVRRRAAILDNAGVQVLITFARAWTMTQLVKLHSKSLREIVSAETLLGGQPVARHSANRKELGLIQYTSGSTGLPKGVALTHANLLDNLRAYGEALQVKNTDVTISWLPLYHDMGLIGSLLGSIYHGVPLVLMGPQDFLARPSRWLKAIDGYRGTISPAPNFAYEVCARRIPDEELQGIDLSSWRVALNGAEPVRLETLQRFSERYAPYGFREESHFPAYGLAEAALAVAFSPLDRKVVVDRVSQAGLEKERTARPVQPGEVELQLISCGLPLNGTELAIRDPQGQPLPDRQEGSLFFRSGSALDCYFDNPQATRAIKDEQGWVATGDLAYLADGELYITGRVKDIIVKAGRNLHPQDIEDLVASVEGVRRGCVAAFGVHDAQAGSEKLVVVFETRLRDAAARQLGEEVQKRVAQGAGVPPDHCVPVAPGLLPKTPSGKIRRSECAQRYTAGTLSKKTGVFQQVARLVRGGRNFRGDLLRMPLRILRGLFDTASMFGVIGTPGLLISQFKPRMALNMLPGACRTWLRLVRLPLRVEGKLPGAPCLVVSNHCSLIDSLVVLAATRRGLKFLIAPWIYEHPIFARGMRALGHLRATRGDTTGASQLSAHIAGALAQGDSVMTFPEGGIETSPGLRPFSLGIFQVAAQTGAPIVPMAIRGTRHALPWPNLLIKPTRLEVVIGPPMKAGGTEWEHAVELSQRARAWIAEHCGETPVQQRLRRAD